MRNNKLLMILTCFMFLSSFAFSQDYDNSNLDLGEISYEETTQSEESEERIINETNTSVGNALKAIFGNVIEKEQDSNNVEITLSVPLKDIETMLNTSLIDNWYPCFLKIESINENNSIVNIKLTKTQNDSHRHFRVLGKLTAPGKLPWKKSGIDDKEAYVTTIETDFGKSFLVKGETKKSGLIFTKLSPRISSIGADKENLDSERFSSKEKFDRKKIFTRETYYDNDTGINGQPFFERGTYIEHPKVGRYMVFTLRCRW